MLIKNKISSAKKTRIGDAAYDLYGTTKVPYGKVITRLVKIPIEA